MVEASQWRMPDALGAKMAEHREIYYALIVTLAELQVKHPSITVTLKDMLAAQEMFHLLQPLLRAGSWKWNCKEYFRDCICSYSTLFRMVWFPDSDCTVPDKYSSDSP
jgi:hypothetical protein